MLGGQRQTGELVLDADPEFFRLLLQKRAGAGGAGFVHGEIHDHAFFQADELRVLTANLEDRIHRLKAELIANVSGAGLMSRDLVVDGVCPNQFADQFTAAAGGAHAADLDPVADLLLDLLQPGGDDFDGAALRAQVNLVEQLPIVIDEHQVGRNRTDVDPEEGANFFPGSGTGESST